MTARVTEDRQYRFWDKTLAEGVADKLVARRRRDRRAHGSDARLEPGSSRRSWIPASTSRPTASRSRWRSTPRRRRTASGPNLDVYLIPTDGSGAMQDLTADNPFTDDSPAFLARRPVDLLPARGASTTPANRRIARIDSRDRARARTLTQAYDRSFDAVSFCGRRKNALHRRPRTEASSRSSGSAPTGRGSRASTREGSSTGISRARTARSSSCNEAVQPPGRDLRFRSGARARRAASRASTTPPRARSISAAPSRGSSAGAGGDTVADVGDLSAGLRLVEEVPARPDSPRRPAHDGPRRLLATAGTRTSSRRPATSSRASTGTARPGSARRSLGSIDGALGRQARRRTSSPRPRSS